MNKEILKRYAELKIEAKILAEKIEELQPEVMAMIEEAGGADVVETDFGTFTIGHRRNYTYPAHLVTALTAIKESQKESEATGAATYVDKPYLLFKSLAE